MARLHLTTIHGAGNPFAGLVDCGIRPAGTKVPDSPPGVGWVDERVAELKSRGISATVVHVPGEPPVVTYRTT